MIPQVSDNPGAAAKLSLLRGKPLQAFEFTLQLNVRQLASAASDAREEVSDRVFRAFLFYLRESSSEDELIGGGHGQVQVVSSERRQLFERLIACWQDQKFSFIRLENLFLQVK